MRTKAGASMDSGEALLRRMAARRRRDNIIFTVLALLAVIGGMRAIFGFFSGGPAGPSDATTVTTVGHAQVAGSFAEEFVETYLSASVNQKNSLARYVNIQQLNLPSVGQRVSEPEVVYVRRVADGDGVEVWAVTVSVKLGDAGTGASTASSSANERRYYRVAISVGNGTLRALSPPAQVPPYAQGLDLATRYGNPCSSDSELARVATGFLGAYLTGNGDVTRYTTSDSGIGALSPAPYGGIAAVTVSADDSGCGASGSTAQVLATVTPKTASGTTAPLAYPLTLVRSGGHWQVKTLDYIPSLSDPITMVAGNDDGQGSATDSSTTPTTTSRASSAASAAIPPATHN